MKYCPRTIALKAGKIAYDGPSSALTPEFLNQIYGAESEALFLPAFADRPELPHDEDIDAVPSLAAWAQRRTTRAARPRRLNA